MKVLLFVLLVGYAVKCDDNNDRGDGATGCTRKRPPRVNSSIHDYPQFNKSYYVVEIQEDLSPPKPFKVYWNVPTKQCRSKRIPFDGLYDKFGIIQNDNDAFRGEKVTILYDPGLFPALLKNESSGKFRFRNGGVPQEGDLAKHLEAFKNELVLSIPDENFDGIGIIDFESWRPVYRQNFGVLQPYKDISYEIERSRNWLWQKKWIQEKAKRRFEHSARAFMLSTLTVAKQLRPRAQWGYYGFPYCFNIASNNMKESCASKVPEENDQISWLFHESTALYPSVYSSIDLSTSQLTSLIRGRVREASRFQRNVLPYFWYKYRDAQQFLTEVDLNAALKTFYESNATGFIIWGSSNDVNTVEKCVKLHDYIENVFGPAITKYTKPLLRDPTVPDNDMSGTTVHDEVSTTTENRVNVLDPEYHWIPPENYTQNIKDHVKEEINKKLTNYTETGDNTVFDNNVLIDLILNSILYYNVSYVENTTESNVDSEITIAQEGNDLLNESSISTTTQESKAFEAVTNIYEELETVSSTERAEFFEATSVDQSQATSSNRLSDITTTEESRNKNIKKTSTQNRQSMDDADPTMENAFITESTELNNSTQASTDYTLGFNDHTTEILNKEVTTETNVLSTNNIESSENLHEYSDVDILETSTAVEYFATSNSQIITNAYSEIGSTTTESNTFNKPEVTANAHSDLNETNEIIDINKISTEAPETEDKHGELNQNESTEGPEFMTETDSTKLLKDTSLAPPTTPNQVSGSTTRVSRPQSLFCFIFYIYSISKCLCSIFGQCS